MVTCSLQGQSSSKTHEETHIIICHNTHYYDNILNVNMTISIVSASSTHYNINYQMYLPQPTLVDGKYWPSYILKQQISNAVAKGNVSYIGLSPELQKEISLELYKYFILNYNVSLICPEIIGKAICYDLKLTNCLDIKKLMCDIFEAAMFNKPFSFNEYRTVDVVLTKTIKDIEKEYDGFKECLDRAHDKILTLRQSLN